MKKLLITLIVIYLIFSVTGKIGEGVAFVQAIKDSVMDIPRRLMLALKNFLRFLNPFTWFAVIGEFVSIMIRVAKGQRTFRGGLFDFRTAVLSPGGGSYNGGGFSYDR